MAVQTAGGRASVVLPIPRRSMSAFGLLFCQTAVLLAISGNRYPLASFSKFLLTVAILHSPRQGTKCVQIIQLSIELCTVLFILKRAHREAERLLTPAITCHSGLDGDGIGLK